MQPGWMMPCFNVADLPRSTEFYERLGFRVVGGKPAEGYAVLANGPVELGLYSGHFEGWMLNFRGENVPALTEHFAALGLNIPHQSGYDATQWPTEWNADDDGQPLPDYECGDCIVTDPDGRTLYFDTVPAERMRYLRGAPYATDGYDGSYAPGQPQLGTLQVELTTAYPPALGNFYEHLGLLTTEEESEDRVEVFAPPQTWRLVLLAGMEPSARFVLESGRDEPQELVDPDGYRLILR